MVFYLYKVIFQQPQQTQAVAATTYQQQQPYVQTSTVRDPRIGNGGGDDKHKTTDGISSSGATKKTADGNMAEWQNWSQYAAYYTNVAHVPASSSSSSKPDDKR